MTRWEYTTIQVVASGFEDADQTEQYQTILNQYGSDGWELVSAAPFVSALVAGQVVVLIFKRPLTDA